MTDFKAQATMEATLPSNAARIFVFDEAYPFRAAQEQAEKKKLNAFGVMAKFNPLNRPKEDTVQLSREELRFEPFWHIRAQREVDYSCQLTYQVPVHNPYAQRVVVDALSFEVTRQKDKARIELQAVERCHRRIDFDKYMDGMERQIKPGVLRAYIDRFTYSEVESLDDPRLVKPLLPLQVALQRAKAELAQVAITATEIARDAVEFERAHLYVRPVFSFEYRWSSADKVGVIEVDGLTGEVIEDGRWFVDKIGERLDRERLIDLGAEAAGLALPGGGLMVKAAAYASEPTRKPE